MNPASRVVQIFAAYRVKRQPLAPHAAFRPGINTLDKAGENSCVGIRRSSGQKHGIRVPCYSGDGTSDGLFQMLRDPPVIFFLKVAYGNDAGTRADCELELRWGPTNKGSGTVNAE